MCTVSRSLSLTQTGNVKWRIEKEDSRIGTNPGEGSDSGEGGEGVRVTVLRVVRVVTVVRVVMASVEGGEGVNVKVIV